MELRPSRVLRKLRNGEIAISTKLNLADVRVAEIAAMSGFDCLWNDMEHIPNDWSAIQAQIFAAKAYDVDVMVRVSRGGYSDYVRPLEADATAIMVPHVMSLEDAKSIVRMTKFHPLGRRPLDGGNSDGKYCKIDTLDYMKQANQERFVVLQIEDPEPLPELDAIAALEGVDMLFFGPGDFSQGIGCPAAWDDPRISDARKLVAEVCQKHGKIASTVGSPANVDELVDMGYRFINLGADVIGLTQYYDGLVSKFPGNEDGVYK